MSTTSGPLPAAAAARGSGLSPAQLAALRPHIVNLRDGKLATGPGGEGELYTTLQDLDDLFTRHLPAFTGRGGTVPLVLFAHGGLVTEANGLRAAHRQIPWWKANGVYPVYFAWETGLVPALGDALAGWLSGSRGLGDVKDRVVEVAARFGQGRRIWEDMKLDAEAAVADGGGALAFADRLGTYLNQRPGSVSVHAVGHSAGAIFHSHFLPAARFSGVDRVESLSLLAPAVRTDLFKEKLLPEVGRSIGRVDLFTMTEESEKADNCARIYGKSLLYLVRASFEPEEKAPILGLQECIEADDTLRTFFRPAGTGLPAEVVWAPVEAGPRNSSKATSHGDFDDDRATMSSVLRRIVGRDDVEELPGQRSRATTWQAAAPAAPEPAWPRDATRKALCIGIDEYPDPRDQLAGCVADAGSWATELERAGFAVHTVVNAAATRENILLRMLEMVSGSVSGDVLVIQYAGHGTTAPDLDGDEAASGQVGNTEDEALCPVDFRSGELIIDDDLGLVWDVLPEGVALTLFFDSCHSGSAQRVVQSLEEEARAAAEDAAKGVKRRYAVLAAEDRRQFRRCRGYDDGSAAGARRAAASTQARARGPQREVLFSACRPDEFAFEVAGHGVFTTRAAPLLGAALGRLTNEQFHAQVADGFDARQHPELHGPVSGRGRILLAVASDGAVSVPAAGGMVPVSPPPSADVSMPVPARTSEARAAKVAALLRAIADVIED
ncbi:hypothetical protein GCM10023081_06650 [Arthrobacter ginkgonis]|uniref:Peptidase C14 caspase domain-containing protein n=1 Tax=Arthrobacter ginkgonis TaxID=1630594 RepID=A0ABP7BY01_9MICC